MYQESGLLCSVVLSIMQLFIMFSTDCYCIDCCTLVKLVDSAFMFSFYADMFMHIAFIVLN